MHILGHWTKFAVIIVHAYHYLKILNCRQHAHKRQCEIMKRVIIISGGIHLNTRTGTLSKGNCFGHWRSKYHPQSHMAFGRHLELQ